jgi:hypothetical protein
VSIPSSFDNITLPYTVSITVVSHPSAVHLTRVLHRDFQLLITFQIHQNGHRADLHHVEGEALRPRA